MVGITYNKEERGVYALILQELGGTRRLPIVIGMSEAQSIECKLQEIITPRPLTHDLIVNVMRDFGIGLERVVIRQIDGGIFVADLHLTDGERNIVVDSRSSDGVSVALRMGVPILVHESLLSRVGVTANINPTDTLASRPSDTEDIWNRVQTMQIKELDELLEQFVAAEEYENAERLKEIIRQRKDEADT